MGVNFIHSLHGKFSLPMLKTQVAPWFVPLALKCPFQLSCLQAANCVRQPTDFRYCLLYSKTLTPIDDRTNLSSKTKFKLAFMLPLL